MSHLLPGLLIIAAGLVPIGLVLMRRTRQPAAPATVVSAGVADEERRFVVEEPANPLLDYSVRDRRAGIVVYQHFELGQAQRRANELNAAAKRVHARVTRSCVSVYRGHGADIRLLAVWRWSRIRRQLVAYDRRQPEWSPEWSRELAERALREAR